MTETNVEQQSTVENTDEVVNETKKATGNLKTDIYENISRLTAQKFLKKYKEDHGGADLDFEAFEAGDKSLLSLALGKDESESGDKLSEQTSFVDKIVASYRDVQGVVGGGAVQEMTGEDRLTKAIYKYLTGNIFQRFIVGGFVMAKLKAADLITQDTQDELKDLRKLFKSGDQSLLAAKKDELEDQLAGVGGNSDENVDEPSEDDPDEAAEDLNENDPDDLIEVLKGKEQILFDTIKSEPHTVNPNTNVTQCSATASENMQNIFNIKVQKGKSANTSMDMSIENLGKLEDDNANNFYNPVGNVADVFFDSSTKNGKIHGHRNVAFKNYSDNKWYILDPYYYKENGNPSRKPILLTDYFKLSNVGDYLKIKKVNFYTSNMAVVDKRVEVVA